MRFLVPAAGAALLAVPAIVALYMLKVRGPEVRVASLVLWPRHVVDRQAHMPWKRLRSSPLLLIQLLVAVAVAGALMRPGVTGAGGNARTTVVVIDSSVTMSATDVKPSRFAAAVSTARRMADRLGQNQQMALVLMGPRPEVLASPTSDPGILRHALDRATPSGGTADVAEGLALADALLAGQAEGSVVLLSDGRARRPEAAVPLRAPLRFESIGRTGENLALARLGLTAEGEVYVRLDNAGEVRRDARVEIRADGILVDILPLVVEGGAVVETTWRAPPEGVDVIEARLVPGDYFTVDDSAWLVTSIPEPQRVLLVTEGNGFLTRALTTSDDVTVTEVRPQEYAGGVFDLYVFDGFLPDGPVPRPAVLVNPPPGRGPAPVGDVIDPGEVLPPDPRDPLMAYVSLLDVHVQAASTTVVPPGWRAPIAAANGPLLLLGPDTERVAQFNFDIHRSDLPLRSAFPILVRNLLADLLAGVDGEILPLGQPARIVAAPATTGLRAITPSGRSVELGPGPIATLADTSDPGVYTVEHRRESGLLTTRFVVGLAGAESSIIAPGEAPLVRATDRPPGEPSKGTVEIWPWIAALVLAALAVEWVLFLRG